MKNLIEEFLALSPTQKREVHFFLCGKALAKWLEYADSQGEITYAESVCGTEQTVAKELPGLALESAKNGTDPEDVRKRYQEPIVAMQDDDLVFPENIRFIYYSIYNLFEKYALNKNIDDWLIVNQALSFTESPEILRNTLEEAIKRSTGEIY